MNVLVLAGGALPVAATYMLLRSGRAGISPAYAIALAIGMGLGIASCTFFLALVLFDGQRAGVIAIDGALLALALAVWWRSDSSSSAPRAPLSSSERALAVAVAVAALAGAVSFLANTLDAPHGRWDAWSTWNVRARCLAGAGPAWRAVFAKPAMHGDYPLLLPGTIARLWVYGGANEVVVPVAVAAAYGTALVLLLHAALAALRGRAQALIGALCMLGTPVFLRVVSWQYADGPLAFHLLAVVTLLSLYARDPAGGRTLLVWAGVATGLVAWTKNEGMLFAFGIGVLSGVWMIVRRPPGGLRAAAWFATGLLPPLAIVLYFKLVLAPRSAQFAQSAESMMGRIVDLGRYGTILRAAAYELVRGTGPVLFALAVYAILLGRTRDRRARGLAAGVLSVVGFAALGDGFAYVTTRAPLPWMLSNSMERIILQLWPSILLAVLLYVASPSERDAPAPTRASTGRPKPAPRRGRRAGRR